MCCLREQERIRREMTEQERLKQAAIDLKARQEEETRLQKVAEEERKRQNWVKDFIGICVRHAASISIVVKKKKEFQSYS